MPHVLSSHLQLNQDLTSPPTNPVKALSPITDTTHATNQRSPQNIRSVQALERGMEVGQSWLKEAGNVDDNGGEQTPDMEPGEYTT